MEALEINDREPISAVLEETFRKFYSSIEFSGVENRVICITSSMAHEGKSFVAFNLAKIMGEGDKSVLLIDGDVRNSSFAKKLGYDKNIVGLTHVLSGQNNIVDAVYSTNYKNLYIMPSGVLPKNAVSLFRNNRLSKLVSYLRGKFDYIIIDTAPVGIVTDAALIAKVSDASVMVVEARRVSRKDIRKNIETLKQANDNFLGVILNKTDSFDGSSRYGKHYGAYGRKYGYGYGYGYYGKRKGE